MTSSASSIASLVPAGTVGEVYRFVPGSSGRTLLVLHGTGGGENDLLPLARHLDPEAALLSPRGPVLEGGQPRFFRRLGMGVFDQDDLRRRTAELGAFVRAAAAAYGFDPARLVAVGYSNGANVAASLLLRDGAALAGAVLLRPMLPFEPDTVASLAGKPIYLAAGRRDPYASVETVEALAEHLRRGGARVDVAWTSGGHGLEPGEVEAAKAWIGRLA